MLQLMVKPELQKTQLPTMNLAVITVTGKGAALGSHLCALLAGKADLFVKAGRQAQTANLSETVKKQIQTVSGQEYQVLSELICKIFSEYDGLIFIMATGIVVRVIAPYVQDKRCDPAVVVMDDSGNYAISLLSGHIGGANELARTIGQLTGAQAVITTATDTAGRPAADVLAVKLGLQIEPFARLKAINAALAAGERVAFFLGEEELPETVKQSYRQQAAKLGIELQAESSMINSDCYDAAVMITARVITDSQSAGKPCLYLRPPCLAVGIGCRRGTACAEIMLALQDACLQAGYSAGSIACLASATVKADEEGLLAAAANLKVPAKFFLPEELQQCIDEYNLEISQFVQKEIGVGNVCEAAALLAGQRPQKLLLSKTKYSRITVAIARVR